MKKLFNLFLLLAIFPLASQAQITITADDISPVGFSAVQSRDSFPDAAIQPGGTGAQTWDFSSLKDMAQDTLAALDPATTPYAANHPGASFAVKRDTALYLYLSNNTDALKLLGISGKLNYQNVLVEGTLQLLPSQTILQFPATESTAYNETVTSIVQVPGSAIGSTFDSLRLKTITNRDVKFEAFGELTTPSGTFQTLRATETEAAIDSGFIFQGGIWFPLQSSVKDTVVFYNWWTNTDGLGFPLVQIESNTAGQIKMVSWLKDVISSTGEAGQLISLSVFPNPASHFLTVEMPGVFEGSLEIYDMKGRLALTRKIMGQIENINLQSLATGSHVVVLKNKKGQLTGSSRFEVVRY